MKIALFAALTVAAALVAAPPALAGPVGDPVPSYAYDPPVPTPGSCGSAFVAYSGTETNGGTLVVWLEGRDGTEQGSMIRAALVGVDGQLESTPIDVSVEQASRGVTDCYGNPTVTAGPDGEFLVLWGHEDLVSYDEKIVGQVISADGTRSGSNFAVTGWHTDFLVAEAAWSPTDNRYLVTIDEATGAQANLGVFIDRDGAVIGSEFAITSIPSPGWPDIAFGSGVWVPVVADCSDSCDGPFGSTVTASGSPSPDFQVPPSLQDGSVTGNSIVYNDFTSEFLVTWGNCLNYSCYHYARRLDSTGAPVGDLIIVDETSNGSHPRVASGGEDGYLVTWHDWQGNLFVKAVQLGTDGQPLSAPEDVSNPDASSSYRPTVAYSKKTRCFVVAWNGNGNPNNGYTPPEDGLNVWTRNWNPSGSDPCLEPAPANPVVRQKGKAGSKSLKVKLFCGGSTPCEIRLTGQLTTGSGKTQPKTVQVGANGKVVRLRYSSQLHRSLLETGKGKIRVRASETDGGATSTTIRVTLAPPSPVTG